MNFLAFQVKLLRECSDLRAIFVAKEINLPIFVDTYKQEYWNNLELSLL